MKINSSVRFTIFILLIASTGLGIAMDNSKGKTIYAEWFNKTHGKSMDRIKSVDKGKAASCLPCHQTEKRAFEAKTDKKTFVGGITCNICHMTHPETGKWELKKHKFNKLKNGMVIPAEISCLKCHNDKCQHFKGFDYQLSVRELETIKID